MHLCKLHTLQVPKATNCLSDIKPDKLVLNTVFFLYFIRNSYMRNQTRSQEFAVGGCFGGWKQRQRS